MSPCRPYRLIAPVRIAQLAARLALCVAVLTIATAGEVAGQSLQPQRLPPVGPVPANGFMPDVRVTPPAFSVVRPVQFDRTFASDFDAAMSPPLEPSSVATVVPLHRSRTTDAKDGVLQRAAIEATWFSPSGTDDVGLTEFSTGITLGAPLGGGALLLSPLYTLSLFDGPDSLAIPSDLHGLALNIKYFRQFTEGIGAAFWVVPGLYSDFKQDHNEALRVGGGAVATWQRTPAAKWILGVIYLDRKDISVLPAVGLIWTPSDIVRFDLVFPRPEAKWLALNCAGVEWWAFVAGELGGNTWAYQQLGGTSDELTYRDYRVTLGVERRSVYNIKSRFEVGYVFSRELETENPSRTIDLDDTVMLRGGIVY